MEEIFDWLVVAHAPGLGIHTFNTLLEAGYSPSRLLKAVHENEPIEGVTAKTFKWLKLPDTKNIEKDLEWLEKENNHIILFSDPCYPPLLKEIIDPPPVLYVHGDVSCLSHYQISMVGSRNPTGGGSETAQQFAHTLAQSGFVITSGLALGIDAASHRGAMFTGGKTIAVTGTGLDRVYPARNKHLAHEIVEKGGALVSEFPIGTPPLANHFPRRNRIVSGLSLGVLVIEAAQRSGSLITARLAAEQGREVFAIPGSIHNPLAKGCHRLIRQGAKLVETVDDILEELGPLAHVEFLPKFSAKQPENREIPEKEYRDLLECIGYDPISVDMLIERTGLTIEKVSSMLLILELRGFVSSAAGGFIIKTTKESVL